MIRRLILSLACLALALALPGCLDFSPDGTQIVFPWDDGLAILRTDGTGMQSLPEGGTMPVWSPDGKHILFFQEVDKITNLMLYDTAQKKTTRIGAKYEPPAVWREDGQRFAALHKTEKGESEMVWSNLQGVVSLRMTLPFDRVGDLKMVWLPGTDSLALIGNEEKGNKTNVYTLEEGEVKRVTKTNDVIGLALSGDKKKLVWARKSPNLAYILLSMYAYDLTARSVAQLPFPDRVPLLNPDPRHAPNEISYVAFSPDGNRLALLAKMPAGTDTKTKQKLQTDACYVLRMDGSEARLIEKTPPSEEGDGVIAPVWSHNGAQLALLYADEKRQEIKLFSADGKEAKTLKSAMPH